jgi:hypothetical protein
MKAKALVGRRVVIAENAFAEIVIWQLTRPLPGSPHAFKYRLAYVVDEVCVLRYGNEAGKGDHRHDVDGETAYRFVSPRQLMDDFMKDITRWQHEHSDS